VPTSAGYRRAQVARELEGGITILEDGGVTIQRPAALAAAPSLEISVSSAQASICFWSTFATCGAPSRGFW
jgi:hypothetical protein